MLLARKRGERRDVELALDQALNEMQSEATVAGILNFALFFQAAHLRALIPVALRNRLARGVSNGFTVVQRDGWHVLIAEELVLVVAHDDQDIEPRRRNLGLHALH